MRAQQITPCLLQMLYQYLRGAVRIAGDDGVVQRPVLAVVAGDGVRIEYLVLADLPLGVVPDLIDLTVKPKHQGITSALGETKMERFVTPGKYLRITTAVLHSTKCFGHALQIPGVSVANREPRHIRLHRHAHVNEFQR